MKKEAIKLLALCVLELQAHEFIHWVIDEIIYADSQYFSLKKETLCNMVVQGLGFEKLTDIGNDILDKTKSLSFNLNDINTELFPEMLKQSRANTEVQKEH